MGAVLNSRESQELVHDLGNLLAAIHWTAGTLLARTPPSDDHLAILGILQAAEQACELTRRLATGIASERTLGADEPRAPEPLGPTLIRDTILLIEDSELLRPLMRRALEAGGFPVLDAPGPDRALDLAQHHRREIGLVIADLMIPGRSGAQIASEVRELCPETAVLLISGAPSTDGSIPSADGVEAFLAKPFTLEQLLARAREALRRRTAPGEAGL
jgi:CheY-like chemotaxis protein